MLHSAVSPCACICFLLFLSFRTFVDPAFVCKQISISRIGRNYAALIIETPAVTPQNTFKFRACPLHFPCALTPKKRTGIISPSHRGKSSCATLRIPSNLIVASSSRGSFEKRFESERKRGEREKEREKESGRETEIRETLGRNLATSIVLVS